MNITEAFEQNKGKVIIWYPFHLGGSIHDRGLWCAEKDREVLDYHNKNTLINWTLSIYRA
jgi:hypothetical protein